MTATHPDISQETRQATARAPSALAGSLAALVPEIVTERLRLRAPRLSDFEPFAAHCASPRALFEFGTLDRAGAWREFASAAGQWLLKGYGAWSIEARSVAGIAPGTYVGELGLFHPAHYPEVEIGWTVMAEAEGKGVAAEAARAVRAHAWRALGLTTLVSYIDAGNARSIRLAERLGAVRDPAAPHPPNDPCLVFRHPAPEAGR